MAATIRGLLAHRPLGLRLLSPAESTSPAEPLSDEGSRLDAPITWAHSSDLMDPTPFLSAGQLLLTTGTQFRDSRAQPDYDDYVLRLAEHGVAGLGFGPEVVTIGAPTELVDTCERHGVPLFEVPYSTPFIAVVRFIADTLSTEAFARDAWALKAHRAISIAALRADGLSATLRELSDQLGRWVALLDPAGRTRRVFPDEPSVITALAGIRPDVTRLLRLGQRSSVTVALDGHHVTVQTLGRPHQLRGALVIGGSGGLDQASQTVVTNVIALAGLALEQGHALDGARSHLRSGLFQALLSDNLELVAGISEQMWGPLPPAPIRLAALRAAEVQERDRVLDQLEVLTEDHPGRFFYAIRDDTIVLCLGSEDLGTVEALVADFALDAGVSAATDYPSIARALHQADQALRRTAEGNRLVEFDRMAASGVFEAMAGPEVEEVAALTLAPLRRYDLAHGTTLERAVKTWLEHNGQWDPAARELAIHRQTLRSRIEQVERILGRELQSFNARAELWAALIASPGDVQPPAG